MDSRAQGSRPRPQKKIRGQDKNRPFENRPRRGQKHECLSKDTTLQSALQKRTGLCSKNCKFSAKLKRFPKKEKIFAQKNRKFSQKKRCQNCFARFLAGHFRELAGFEAKFKDFKLVLQDSTSAIKLGTKFCSAKT